ncbi:hypothetical protein FALCPG4_014827 [Fusarium falciforme]
MDLAIHCLHPSCSSTMKPATSLPVSLTLPPRKLEGHDSGDDSDDEEHHARKRRRVPRSPPHTSVRSTPTSARSSRQRRSTRRHLHSPREHRISVCDIEDPTPSQATSVPSEARKILARFEEWPLKDASLKRITEGSRTTFQLQFEWAPDPSQQHADRSVSHSKGGGPPKASLSATRSSGGKWTTEEEDTVRTMRRAGRSWAEIQRVLPHRSQGTIQVRYSTKINKKG